MQAVILCGGEGKRLRPLTKEIAKPMVIINGKPFLEHQILYLKKYGIKNFLFCAGYKWGLIFDYFEYGSKWDVNIDYSTEKRLLGTGGALKLAEKHIRKNFLLIYGDSFIPINYKSFYNNAKIMNKIGVMLVYNNKKDTHVKNNTRINKKGLVIEYGKLNFNKSMKYVDAGVIFFKKQVLNFIPQHKKVSLENDIFKKLINIKELASIRTNRRFYDIGNFERLKEIEKVIG